MQDCASSERAFVGAILSGLQRATDSGLTVDQFDDPFCAHVFAACVGLEMRGKVADLVTVGELEGIDACALVGLTGEAAVQASVIGQHGQNIRERAQRREAARLFASAAGDALDAGKSLPDTINGAQVALDRMAAQTDDGDTESGVDVLCNLYASLGEPEAEPAISTGLYRLDTALGGGWRGGKMIVVAARPAVGKTALMLFSAVHALKAGKRVLIDSLEMTAQENARRMLALTSGVSTGRMIDKQIDDDDWQRLADGIACLPGENFRFVRRGNTVQALRREALRMRAQGGMDLIVVDYLQLMSAAGKTNGRTEAVGEISRSLKLLAMELGVPILVGSQCNRASAGGEEIRPPRLSELRESGSIEQDADVVLILHAPSLQGGARELYIAKNRDGETGMTRLIFDGARMRFAQAN